MRKISYALLSLLVVGRLIAAQDRAIDSTATSWTYQSQNARFTAEVVATGLQRPVALSFLPDGRLLVADRQIGQLSILDVRTGTLTAVTGVPAVHGKIDGGLLDVLVHPQYAGNGWIYLAYAAEGPDGNATVVDRARLVGPTLTDRVRVFTARPAIANSNEFGSRLVLQDGFLFVTVGQRNTPAYAQDLGSPRSRRNAERDGNL